MAGGTPHDAKETFMTDQDIIQTATMGYRIKGQPLCDY